jgi:MFS family permease
MLSVLRIRKFLVFSVAQAISNFGDKLDYMALLAMIAALAARHNWESSRANSFLLVVATLPVIIFGPLAGVLVDRWNRRKVMIVCDSCRALLVFSIPFVAIRTQSLPLVFTIAFSVFLLGMIFNTARLSVIPNLVDSHNILEANSVASLLGRVMTFLGMLVGGLIVDWQFWRRLGMTETWSAGFYIDALTFVGSVTALLLLPLRLPGRPASIRNLRPDGELAHLDSGNHVRRSRSVAIALSEKLLDVLRDFREAYVLMRKSPPVRLVLFSIVLFVIIGAGVVVLLVPILQTARDDLGLGVGTRGVGFVGAVGSVGLVLSSLVYGFIGRRFRKRKAILSSFALLGLLAMLIAFSESMALTLLLAFIAGILLAPIYIAQDTLLHETVPEEARGRVFSTREWFMNLSAAISALCIGQILILMPDLNRGLALPLGIVLDDRRLLLCAIGFVVGILSLIELFRTRKQGIT